MPALTSGIDPRRMIRFISKRSRWLTLPAQATTLGRRCSAPRCRSCALNPACSRHRGCVLHVGSPGRSFVFVLRPGQQLHVETFEPLLPLAEEGVVLVRVPGGPPLAEEEAATSQELGHRTHYSYV